MIVKEIIKNIEKYNFEDKESALSMCIFLLLKEKQYNKGFNQVRIMKVNEEYMMYVPKCNYAKEFDNNIINDELIIDYNANGIRKISSDYDDCVLRKYIKREEKEDINKFKNMIINSESAFDFYKTIEKEMLNNEMFIHNINRYIFQESQSYNSAIKILEDICFTKKENFKESLYNQDFNSKIYPRNNSDISFYENNKSISKLYKYIRPQKELIEYLVDNKEIEKVFLIGQKNKAKKYLEEKYNKDISDILLSDMSNELKYLKIIDKQFKEQKNNFINEINKIDNYGIIEEIELYRDKRIEKICDDVKNRCLSKKELICELIEVKSGIELSKEIENITNLNFLNNTEYYLMFQGIQYGISYFTKEIDNKPNYIIIKDNNELVGYLSYKEENNLIKIDCLEIYKSHRNQGIGTKILEELAKVSEAKNKVIYNSRYSDEGVLKLPSKKQKLNQTRNCLFIDTHLSYLNEDIVNYIRKQNNFNLKKFKETYISTKENIKLKRDNEILNEIIKDYEFKLKNKLIYKV